MRVLIKCAGLAQTHYGIMLLAISMHNDNPLSCSWLFTVSQKPGEVHPLRSTLINNTDLISLTITNGVAKRYQTTRFIPSI